MARSEALVEPSLLIWARESAGLDVETVARKLQVKPDRVERWERGEAKPTVRQLRNFGKACKRPLAVFYLPEPPADFQALRDFRRLPGRVEGVLSPQLRYEIRRAHIRREVALDLYSEVGEAPPEFDLEESLSNDAESVGTMIRRALGVALEDQADSGPGYESLALWRSALERAGVLVFQTTGVDPSEMRGFSIGERPLPVIAVNSKDRPRGRVFTMLHEIAHVALRGEGLCDLDEGADRAPEAQAVEVFCNGAAGATLVPGEVLLGEGLVRAKGPHAEWTPQELRRLANRFGVSREVVLRRLLILGRTTDDFYRIERERLEEEYRALAERSEEGFAPPHQTAIGSAGRLFVRLVLENYHQDKITASDVSEFLGVRLKHLDKIEATVLRGPILDRGFSS